MENEIRQPLDDIMTQLGLSNADLVHASTEQLSFKMVNKGRKGRRLTLNIQQKILMALLKVKPELKLGKKDLFRYEVGEPVAEPVEIFTPIVIEKRNENKPSKKKKKQRKSLTTKARMSLNKRRFRRRRK